MPIPLHLGFIQVHIAHRRKESVMHPITLRSLDIPKGLACIKDACTAGVSGYRIHYVNTKEALWGASHYISSVPHDWRNSQMSCKARGYRGEA